VLSGPKASPPHIYKLCSQETDYDVCPNYYHKSIQVFKVTHNFFFVLSAPPKIKTELQNSSCMTDQKMTFTVEVEGMPIPEVKWYVLDTFLVICYFRHHCVYHHPNQPFVCIQTLLMFKGKIMDFCIVKQRNTKLLQQ
jgi:hypothetical protein